MPLLQGSCHITTTFQGQHYIFKVQLIQKKFIYCTCNFMIMGVYCRVFFWQGYVYNKNSPALIATWRPLNLSVMEKKKKKGIAGCVYPQIGTMCALEVWLKMTINEKNCSTPEFLICDTWSPAYTNTILLDIRLMLHTVRSSTLHISKQVRIKTVGLT